VRNSRRFERGGGKKPKRKKKFRLNPRIWEKQNFRVRGAALRRKECLGRRKNTPQGGTNGWRSSTLGRGRILRRLLMKRPTFEHVKFARGGELISLLNRGFTLLGGKEKRRACPELGDLVTWHPPVLGIMPWSTF